MGERTSKFITLGLITRNWKPPRDFASEYDLGENVTLVRVPTWLRRARLALTPLHGEQLNYLANSPNWALAMEYEAGWYRDLNPQWRGQGERSYRDTAIGRFIVANMACWLARPSSLGFEYIVTAERDDGTGLWLWDSLARQSPLWPLSSYQHAEMSHEGLARARTFNITLSSLDLNSPVLAAASMLWAGLTASRGEVRYTMLWAALKALFAPPENTQGATHRLCGRLAIFLTTIRGDASQAALLYEHARADYSARSDIVHGLRKTDIEAEEVSAFLSRGEGWVREALTEILTTSDYIDAFSKEKRETYLQELDVRVTWGRPPRRRC